MAAEGSRPAGATRAGRRRSALPPLLLALALLLGAPGAARPEPLAERLAPCLACHGVTGTSATPEVPSLGGQPASFLLIQLYVFREKQRIAEPMNELTKDLTDDDLRALSDELAKLPPPVPPTVGAEPARIERGVPYRRAIAAASATIPTCRGTTRSRASARSGRIILRGRCASTNPASDAATIRRWPRWSRRWPTPISPPSPTISPIGAESATGAGAPPIATAWGLHGRQGKAVEEDGGGATDSPARGEP